ncbi:CBS domain-containing protein [Croceibacterium sp. TMG7-5b_MA50]|uniref:CBS domain-containing protein n=1 Tax=Croceibacterium sp. TMG7-5b_MA50 TaxID=3121290 RepID=UPI0032218A50
MTIAAILAGRTQAIVHCSPGTSVGDAARLLAERRIGALPVLEGADGPVTGIFSERDLLYCLAEHGVAVLDRPVSDVMTAPVISVHREISVLQALALMTERRIRHLPVLHASDGETPRLIAFLSIGDLVKYRLEKMEREAQDLRDYITSA